MEARTIVMFLFDMAQYMKENKKIHGHHSGATILELLLYVALISVILVLSGDMTMNMLFGKARAVGLEEVSANARVAFQHIENIFDQSVDVSLAPNTASSSISFSLEDMGLTPTIFGVEDGVLWMKQGSGERVYVTTDDVVVQNIEFHRLQDFSGGFAVRISMEVASVVNPAEGERISEYFYTTIHKHFE